MQELELNPPTFYEKDVEEIEPIKTNDLESILNELATINYYDKKNVQRALKIILAYCDEPGNQLTDVRKLLTEIIENI
jgi:hypothetical protein